MRTDNFDFFSDLLREKRLLLDGAMGTMARTLTKDSPRLNAPPPDLLNAEAPEIIREIHRLYLEAGADIITANSFNSNSHSLALLAPGYDSYVLSAAAASLARKEADGFSAITPRQPRFVAGSVGPVSDINVFENPYYPQIKGLIDVGADIILVETITSVQSALLALEAVRRVEEEKGEKVPVILSYTPTQDGSLLSGESAEDFCRSVMPCGPLAVGINCCSSGEEHLPVLNKMAALTSLPLVLFPNAGFPDATGRYPDDAATFTRNLRPYLLKEYVRIIGGCCGTTPAHIHYLKAESGA